MTLKALQSCKGTKACGVQHDTCMSPDTMQDVSLQGVGQLSSGHRSLEQP